MHWLSEMGTTGSFEEGISCLKPRQQHSEIGLVRGLTVPLCWVVLSQNPANFLKSFHVYTNLYYLNLVLSLGFIFSFPV